MRTLSVLSVIAIFVALPVHAESVEEATNRYFDVMRSTDYGAAAELFDPEELKDFRNSLNFLADLPSASKEELFGAFFGPESTQETVDSLSDQQFFSSFYGAAMSQAGMEELMKTAKLEYLGHVTEGENIAHAVTRISMNMQDARFEKMSVVSFVLRGDTWKMKMSGEISGVADKLRDALGM